MHVHADCMELFVPTSIQLQQIKGANTSCRPYARQGCLVHVNQHGDIIVSWIAHTLYFRCITARCA
jgi:hypothetical protein